MTDSENLKQIDRLDLPAADFHFIDHLLEGSYIVDVHRRILRWNQSASNLTGYLPEEIHNKSCFDNILNHIDHEGKGLCFDGCPLKASIEDGQIREAHVFLQHKEGHRIPVKVRIVPLKNEAEEIVGAIEFFIENKDDSSLRDLINTYQRKSFEDPLTRLANRRYLSAAIESKFREYRTVGTKFGIAFLDIDDFKKINDTYGHPIGDKIIRLLADTIKGNLRANDYFGRWGGEEFILIFSQVTEESLLTVSEKIRKLVASSCLRLDSHELRVTVSIGSTIARRNDTVQSLIQRVDTLMYVSKSEGKNRVTLG